VGGPPEVNYGRDAISDQISTIIIDKRTTASIRLSMDRWTKESFDDLFHRHRRFVLDTG
jgi:hypothetical protein